MKKRKSLLRSDSFQTLLTSLLCIILGVAIGYVVLLIINPAGAWKSMSALLKNFFHYPAGKLRMKYFGQTLVRTAPLLMCALSILFAYKVGMFNIGAAGQYVAGACVGLYAAIAWQLPWYLCLLLAIAAGAFLGAISGALRTYCNVNVVISGIMLNWIALYLTNLILTTVKHPNSPYTKSLTAANPSALIPSLGLSKLFAGEKTVTIANPLAILMAVLVWVILNKTKFGYELKACGANRHAARYAGINDKRNIVLSMAIAGGLSGAAAALYYLSGNTEFFWSTYQSLPAIGFNGIPVALLAANNPIAVIFTGCFMSMLDIVGLQLTNLTAYNEYITDVIIATIVYLSAFSLLIRMLLDGRKKRKKAIAAQAGGTDTGAGPSSGAQEGGEQA